MKVVGVIPARWGSTRFAGKVLADIGGRPMIQHVWEQARQCRRLDEVLIACDDPRVYRAAEDFGARAVMTSTEHASGTDRIAEVAQHLAAGIVVNIQGDEPLLRPQIIDALAQALLDDPRCPMATVVRPMTDPREIADPNIVKAVLDHQGYALYFSRAGIPYDREGQGTSGAVYYKHIGLYAYRKDFLLNIGQLPASRLEQTEKLEQLRVLEAGFRIRTVMTDYDAVSVDTPEDLERVRSLWAARSASAG